MALRFTSSTFIFALRRAVPVPNKSESNGCVSSRAWAEGQFRRRPEAEGQALEARLFIEQLFDSEPNALIAVCGDLNSGRA